MPQSNCDDVYKAPTCANSVQETIHSRKLFFSLNSLSRDTHGRSDKTELVINRKEYVIAIPWFVRLYVEIIQEL